MCPNKRGEKKRSIIMMSRANKRQNSMISLTLPLNQMPKSSVFQRNSTNVMRTRVSNFEGPQSTTSPLMSKYESDFDIISEAPDNESSPVRKSNKPIKANFGLAKI